MERLVARYGPHVTRRLRVQYRMHEAIMGFSSAEFYEGDLVADDSVRAHRLCDLPGVAAEPLTETPVHVHRHGRGRLRRGAEDSDSRRNPQEAALVAKQVRALLDAGLSPRSNWR